MADDERLKVIFIGGYTRSGSTLLDRLLGSLAGVQSVGEMRHLWGMGLIENRLCGCGDAFDACPLWRGVMTEAFGEKGAPDARAMQAAEERLFLARYAARLTRPGLLPEKMRKARKNFLAERGGLLRAVAAVSGAGTIVDSSKNPSYGLLLGQIPGLDVRTVHLVRDSRATSYSWTRVKADRRHEGEAAYFPRRPPAISASWWAANGLLMELTSLLAPRRHLRVRYEDLAANPAGEVRRIAAWAGLPAEALPGETVELGVHHSIGGNPMRFEQGAVTIRADDEWRREMPRRAKATVTAITLPLLLRHGYIGPWRRTGSP